MTETSISKRNDLTLIVGLFLIVALGFIAGYRPFGAGFDFYQYWYFYSRIGPFSTNSDFRFERGFVFLARLASQTLELSYYQFATILASASLAIKYKALAGLKNHIAASMFYVCVYFPLHENTQLRVAVAVSILFFSTKYLFLGKWKTFFAVSLLSLAFHTTAIVAIVVLAASYCLSRMHIAYGVALSIASPVILAPLLKVVFPDLLAINPLLEGSLDASINPNIFSITNILTAAFLVCYLFSGSACDRRGKTLFLVSCFGISVFLGLYSVPVIAHRLKEILLVFMTFIAFEYKLTRKTYLQAGVALTLAVGSLYASIITGFFSD